jgi:tetratricopeptide (TPR) repeat protein
MQDLFQLQDELTRAIVESLSVPLSSGEIQRMQHDHPANARAYEMYLRANQLAILTDMSATDLARQMYESALAEDPGFAPAWVRYARACRVLAKYGSTEQGPRNHERAQEAFRRAQELDPELPLFHHLYTYFEVEMGGSRSALRRLLTQARARPSDPDLFSGLVVATRYCGLIEASLAADATARRLDPNIRTSVLYTHLARCDWHRASQVVEDPFVQYYVLPMLGRADEARELYRRLITPATPFVMQIVSRSLLAALDQDADQCTEALRPLIERTHTFVDPEGLYYAARILARAGNTTAALQLLGKAADDGFTCPAPLKCDPWLDTLRGRPGFAEILERSEQGRRAAAMDYLELGGDQVLGVGV